MDENRTALVCKALSDENRLKIITLLARGERCACRLLEDFDISQPTLSHHMKILCGCGLVAVRREGKWSHYSLRVETLSEFTDFFKGLDYSGEESEKCR